MLLLATPTTRWVEETGTDFWLVVETVVGVVDVREGGRSVYSSLSRMSRSVHITSDGGHLIVPKPSPTCDNIRRITSKMTS